VILKARITFYVISVKVVLFIPVVKSIHCMKKHKSFNLYINFLLKLSPNFVLYRSL